MTKDHACFSLWKVWKPISSKNCWTLQNM